MPEAQVPYPTDGIWMVLPSAAFMSKVFGKDMLFSCLIVRGVNNCLVT